MHVISKTVELTEEMMFSYYIFRGLHDRIIAEIEALKVVPGVDQRWLALGNTHIQLAFMQLNRAMTENALSTQTTGDANTSKLKAGDSVKVYTPGGPYHDDEGVIAEVEERASVSFDRGDRKQIGNYRVEHLRKIEEKNSK